MYFANSPGLYFWGHLFLKVAPLGNVILMSNAPTFLKSDFVLKFSNRIHNALWGRACVTDVLI